MQGNVGHHKKCSNDRLYIVLVLLLSCFDCGALAKPITKNTPVTIVVNLKSAYFVAPNGNDDGPGTAERPWATINHAAYQAKAGDTVVVRSGLYVLRDQIRTRNSGRPGAWITFIGYPSERPILDARLLPYASLAKDGHDNGAFQIEDVSHVRVANLTIINSHDAGFTIRDSSNIDLINNSTNGTFSSGIAAWDSNHEGKTARHIKILGNTIARAITTDLRPPDFPTQEELPQEALSVGGATDFEVAYNYIYDSGKEGIDIKETSKHGTVHHNLVVGALRQGIYIDAWFGTLRDVDVSSNVIHHCRGAGLILSAENGTSVLNVTISHNLIFDNDGSGLYFSRWGADHPRKGIRILSNTIHHNGYGSPKHNQKYYWLTGGLFLFSTNVKDILVRNNIFSDNRGFQIGYSDEFLKKYRSWQTATAKSNIVIDENLVDGRNGLSSPIEETGLYPDGVVIHAVNGNHPILRGVLFKDLANYDFTRTDTAPEAREDRSVTKLAMGSRWKRQQPPILLRVRFH